MENKLCNSSEDPEVRKGPWTMEEDLILINHIATHGEGVWNSLAKAAGLKRTGKSCRLRWLNYLRPDVRRGNITAEEQLLIMELQAKWGNRWSKIAKHLPGRTDNEIKNYWRTRIQKHIKQADHHNMQAQSSCETNDDQPISTSQVSPTEAEQPILETYSPFSDYQAANASEPFPATHQHQFPTSSDNNYWSIHMDDFWTLQLLNGD